MVIVVRHPAQKFEQFGVHHRLMIEHAGDAFELAERNRGALDHLRQQADAVASTEGDAQAYARRGRDGLLAGGQVVEQLS
jgi:hypothetical protein